MNLSLALILGLTNLFLVIYITIDSSEKIFNYREYLSGGLLSWDLLRKNSSFTSKPESFRNFIDIFFPARPWLFLIVFRMICGLGLLVLPFNSPLYGFLYASLFIIGFLMNLRNAAYRTETENRFSLIIIGALLLRSLLPTDGVTLTSFWFIALLVCLSYLTTGISKLGYRNWRKGEGFKDIVTSIEFVPVKKINTFFEQHKVLTRLMNWLIILFECTFPVMLFAGQIVFWCFLVIGIFFHVAIAFGFRTGKFFWVWMATYPALIFIAQR